MPQPMPATFKTPTMEASGMWSAAEHERVLEAMAKYPRGPWRQITEHVGSRSIKKVQTHAQKYQQKVLRHQRGLRKTKTKAVRAEHRVDSTTTEQFTTGCIVRKPYTPGRERRSSTSSSVSRSPYSPASSLSTFTSTTDPLTEAKACIPEPISLATFRPAYYGSGYTYGHYYAQGMDSQYAYDANPPAASPVSSIEPLPYSYGRSVAPPTLSEREARALRETLEVLLV